jgi:hypothetical protein
VPIVQAGLAPGPVWAGAENFAFTEIRSSARQSRSESLSRPTKIEYGSYFVNLCRDSKFPLVEVVTLGNFEA